MDFLFIIPYNTQFGENVLICGSCKELGEWKEPLKLDYRDLLWTTKLKLPLRFDYKYIIINSEE